MSPRKIAVIGDNFMLPEAFEDALRRCADGRAGMGELHIRKLRQPWPESPIIFSDPRFPDIREFVGEPDEVAEFVGDAEVLVNHLAPVTAAVLERLPDLRLIAVSRGGPLNIDAAAARRRGIPVVQAPGRNASAVAEFAVGVILAETRRIRAGHEALRAGEWRDDLYRADCTGDELADLAVGIVGFGQIGRRLANLLRPFECRLLVSDPYATADDSVAENMPLDALLAESDVVALFPRVTPETEKMMNRETLAQMKRGSVLVNIARGPLMDYDALREALESGHLGGAVLDTFPVEPPPSDWELLRSPKVTLTPHIAGSSRRTIRRAAETIAEEVVRHLAGEGGTSESAGSG